MSKERIINLGFGNFVVASRVVGIINPASSPMRRLREDARTEGRLVDATQGRKTRSIIITDSNHVILSAILPDTLNVSCRRRTMPDTTPTITARSGVLLVVCAPSGTGKTTLIQRLRDEFPNFAYSISCTTRAPRGHETDGKDYHFLSVEEFLRRREAGFFAEWANVHGNYYGTPLAPVLETLKAGQDVLFDIDVQGAAQLHLSLPRGQYVFLLPPSLSELERRLRGRGTDDEASIARRLSNAASEIRQAHWFDAWIVNDNLDKAYDELRAVYLASTLHPAHRPGLANTILEG